MPLVYDCPPQRGAGRGPRMTDKGKLTRKAVTVQAANGDDVPAHLALCTCGHETFVLFQVMEMTHLHVQCVMCGTTFCPQGGECHAPIGDVGRT